MEKERHLIQTKVDKELWRRFKVTVKDYENKTIREMLEDWMKFELLNHQVRDQGDVSGSFTRAWSIR